MSNLPGAAPITPLLIRIALALLSLTISSASLAADSPHLFTKIANPGGDPRVRSIIELPDGRIAFATISGIEIFNSAGFTQIPDAEESITNIPGYTGHHHLYLSHNGKYLWIKTWGKLQCLDLDTETYISDFPSFFKSIGVCQTPEDIFIDDEGQIWYVAKGKIFQPDSAMELPLDGNRGSLLDLRTDHTKAYLFYADGTIEFLNLDKQKIERTLKAYPAEDEWKFGDTSLVVRHNGIFYQIKNGGKGGLFRIDPEKGTATLVLESDLRLNTLAVRDSAILISTSAGFIIADPNSGSQHYEQTLRTGSGNILSSHISTVLTDTRHAIWLGTLDKGIFRYHPDDFSYHSIQKAKPSYPGQQQPSAVFSEHPDGSILISDGEFHADISPAPGGDIKISALSAAESSVVGEYGNGAAFAASDGSLFFNEPDRYDIFIKNDTATRYYSGKPFISGIQINGERIAPLHSYDGREILSKIPSRQEEITLAPNQNFITVEICDPQFAAPNTELLYKLEGIDTEWNKALLDQNGQKIFKATYTALLPGNYTFMVKSNSTLPSETASLKIRVLPPWWATWWAGLCYLCILTAAIVSAMKVYARKTKRRIAAEQREEALLQRIQHLITEVDLYKAEGTETPDTGNTTSPGPLSRADGQDAQHLSEADRRFIAKAVDMVERNLDTPGYSVEQLSKDLCMDRTGLYRKLTALVDKSPSLFIRDVRLGNAARLIEKGELSITEISEISGFSSTSYMSKCFKERFGCKPSEYKGKPSQLP